MARVTQRVDLSQLEDLVERPLRAAIAFVCGATVQPVPVAYRRSGERIWVGVPAEALPPEGPPERAVLLLDDGCFWFELRAVTHRGRLTPGTQPPSAGNVPLVWLEFVPDHTVAWDYGTLHEEAGS